MWTAWVLGLALVGAGGALAQGRPEGSPVRAEKSRLALPAGSQVVLDASFQEKEAAGYARSGLAPNIGESIGTIRFAEGRVDRFVSLAEVTGLYEAEGVLRPDQRPALVSQPLLRPGPPRGRPVPAPVPPPGASRVGIPPPGAPMPGAPRPGATPGPQPVVETWVFQTESPRGWLVLMAIHAGAEGPTHIRVGQLVGSTVPQRALDVTNAVAADLLAVDLARNPPPVPKDARLAQVVRHVPKEHIPALILYIQQQLPPDVSRPLGAIMQQADGVSVVAYRMPYLVSGNEFFAFYQDVGKQKGWRRVLENPLRPDAPDAIYQLPNRGGILSIYARQQPPQGGLRPVGWSTLITFILIHGNIDVDRAITGLKTPVRE